ncbi:WD40 repeat domain-containing protein [Streptosporangium saharense]|uniref:WD40 repeat domain-containing protein n=1 Tax=Streptosporangium saharense TaxID=1706840 RepID=UPI00344691F2
MKRVRLLLTSVVVLFTALVVVGVEAIHQREATRTASAGELALHGAELRELNPFNALLLGVIATRVEANAHTRSALMGSVLSERRTPVSGTGNVQAAALGAYGLTVLTGDLQQGVTMRRASGSRRGLDEVMSPTLVKSGEDVSALALSADGRTAVTDDGGSMSVWDLTDTSHPVRAATVENDDHTGGTRPSTLTPDGKTVLIGRKNGDVPAWDLSEKSHPIRLFTLSGHASRVTGVAMSSDGRTAVTGGSLGADIWDVTDRAHPTHLVTLPLPSTSVHAVALSPDGRTAMTSSEAGPTVVWELRDRLHPVRVAALTVPGNAVNVVALDPKGLVALTGTPRWGAVTWDLSGIGTDPLRTVCTDPRFEGRFHRPLTQDTWSSAADGERWPSSFGDLDDFRPCP